MTTLSLATDRITMLINIKALVLTYTQSFDDIVHPLKTMGFSVAFAYPSSIDKLLIRNSTVRQLIMELFTGNLVDVENFTSANLASLEKRI